MDPVPKDSSLKFVKGSHKWCQWFHPRKFESGKNYPIEKEYCMEKEFYDVPVDDIENGKYEVKYPKVSKSNSLIPFSY